MIEKPVVLGDVKLGTPKKPFAEWMVYIADYGDRIADHTILPWRRRRYRVRAQFYRELAEDSRRWSLERSGYPWVIEKRPWKRRLGSGFTWEDVDACRSTADAFNTAGGSLDISVRQLRDLATRIESLLPPREET